MTGAPADRSAAEQDEAELREALHVYDLARTAQDPFTAHLHSPAAHNGRGGLPDPVLAALQAAAQAMAAEFTARREEACRQALADGTQGVLADARDARMDPRVPVGQFWQLPVSVTLADVDAGALDEHLEFLRAQVTATPPMLDITVRTVPAPEAGGLGGEPG